MANALSVCETNKSCGGLTWKGNDLRAIQIELKISNKTMYSPSIDWHSFIHIRAYGKIDTLTQAFPPKKSRYTVEIYRERPFLIAVVKNVATEQECQALKDEDSKNFAPASVADQKGKGKVRVDYRRLAKSKGIKQPMFSSTSPLKSYWTRNFALVSALTEKKVWPAGQEPLSLILYNVSGEEFRPHCDGNCHNEPVKEDGARFATSILYCQIADRGGHTHFSAAKVKLKPNKYDLLVFSYLHDDGTNDHEMISKHSGCPILSGEKLIATQWFRKDVSELKTWVDYRNEIPG